MVICMDTPLEAPHELSTFLLHMDLQKKHFSPGVMSSSANLFAKLTIFWPVKCDEEFLNVVILHLNIEVTHHAA